jgi:hypothetical protein
MADPGDADFAFADLRKKWPDMVTGPLGEE